MRLMLVKEGFTLAQVERMAKKLVRHDGPRWVLLPVSERTPEQRTKEARRADLWRPRSRDGKFIGNRAEGEPMLCHKPGCREAA